MAVHSIANASGRNFVASIHLIKAVGIPQKHRLICSCANASKYVASTKKDKEGVERCVIHRQRLIELGMSGREMGL